MEGFSLFFVFLFIMILFIMIGVYYYITQRRIFKSISEAFNIELVNKKEVRGVIDDQKIHGYIREENINGNYKKYVCFDVGNKDDREIGIKAVRLNDFYFFKRKNSSNFKTGDTQFDKQIMIQADDRRNVLGKLDYNTRMTMLAHMNHKYGLKIKSDFIRYLITDLDMSNWKQFIIKIISFSKRLFSEKATDELLIENILNDKELNGVKIKSMEYLTKSPDFYKYEDFFINMLDNPIIEIQIMAACCLKDKVIPKLLKIINQADDKVKLFSLKYISELYENNLIRERIYSFLYSNDEKLISESIRILRDKEDKKSIDIIEHFMNKKQNLIDKSSMIKYCLISYLSKLKVNKGFSWLISLLNDDDKDTVVFSINALKEIGDIKAVEYLFPLTKGLINSNIKKSAQDAINILQQNIPDSNRGVLTMMEESLSGELSVDDEEDQGKLTIEKE